MRVARYDPLEFSSQDTNDGSICQMRQEARHIGALQCYAALRRRIAGPREVKENRTAATAPARRDVPVHDDTDIIEVVLAPHIFMTGLVGQLHRAVIIRVAGCIAPAVAWANAAQAQA